MKNPTLKIHVEKDGKASVSIGRSKVKIPVIEWNYEIPAGETKETLTISFASTLGNKNFELLYAVEK